MNIISFIKHMCIAVCLFFAAAALPAEEITFSADTMQGNTSEKGEYTKLKGSAFIKTETLEIHADEILLNGKDFRYITATGNIKGINSEAGFDFTCMHMRYDRETKTAVLEKSVTLDDTKNKVKAKAHFIEYVQDTEIAVMQIDVRIEQKNNICTAASAVYRKAQQILELSGNPKIERDKDVFKAQEISLNLDTEEITLDGRVSGSIIEDSKESSDKDGKKTADKKSDSEKSDKDGADNKAGEADTGPGGAAPPRRDSGSSGTETDTEKSDGSTSENVPPPVR